MRCNRPILALALAAGLTTRALGWSWPLADQQAPATNLFTGRGTVQIEYGPQYAAPGAPNELKALYGVIKYRETQETFRNYDLFFSPALSIWKFLRYEPNGTTTAQYVGGFNYDNCQDGFVTATDRVFTPAIGCINTTECGLPVTSVRTNYGCQNNHFSSPYPFDIFVGAGGGNGDQPDIVVPPTWNAATNSLFSVTISKPWIYYEGITDPNNPRFLADFTFCPNRAFIQQQAIAALRNVRLENQIRIYPDGTVMLTHIWSDLKGRAWVSSVADGYWLTPDSAPNGRVFYFDPTQNQYVEPFAGGQNSAGLYLGTGNGWVGYFVDQVRPTFGMGFYYYKPGGVSILPANFWPGAPAVLHTDYFMNLGARGRAFRQMFLLIGTKEEMQARAGLLPDYCKVLSVPPVTVETYCKDGIDDDGDGKYDCADPDCAGESACQIEVCIQPTSAQDGSVIVSSGAIDRTSPYGTWGKAGGQPWIQLGLHTLPKIAAAQLLSATLKLPRTDNIFTADETALNLDMRVQQIAAADPTQIMPADGSSPALSDLGSYRPPGSYATDNGRSISVDAKSAVLADINAGRGAFAWRVTPQNVTDNVNSARYFPTVDNTDPAFPGGNRGATLCLRVPLETPEKSCTDMIDNDQDGHTDCADTDCALNLACRVPDYDADGDVDQADFAHLQGCYSPPLPAEPYPNCADADLNNDTRVDAGDFTYFVKCMHGSDVVASQGCLLTP